MTGLQLVNPKGLPLKKSPDRLFRKWVFRKFMVEHRSGRAALIRVFLTQATCSGVVWGRALPYPRILEKNEISADRLKTQLFPDDQQGYDRFIFIVIKLPFYDDCFITNSPGRGTITAFTCESARRHRIKFRMAFDI